MVIYLNLCIILQYSGKKMIKAAILGATGYAGSELVRILSAHKEAELVWLASHSHAGESFSTVHPAFRGICDQVLEDDDIVKAAEAADVVFLALPHGIASGLVSADILSRTVIIDLGADFRLHDADVYESWYKVTHNSKELLPRAVYGLCELHRNEVASARLIANPGCYTTCSILTLYPLVRAGLVEECGIIIDAKSGTSGAGRSAKMGSMYCEVNESVKAYSVTSHRHTPEIEQELSLAAGETVRVQFTPHLIPMDRGILVTCYARMRPGAGQEDVSRAYHEAYDGERFIRLCDAPPETRHVAGSNYVDISWRLDGRTGNIIAMGALDNLVKGAAGQAVQNMNIAFGLDEAEGLGLVPGAVV